MKKRIFSLTLGAILFLGLSTSLIATPAGDNGGIGGYPGGPNVFPHVTGNCYCGKYPVCHPKPIEPWDLPPVSSPDY